MTEPLVQIRGLVKNYTLEGKKIEVLKGIDVDIQESERISITGRSGSGKSTFLHLVGTLDEPTGGTILYHGKDVFKESPARVADFRNRTVGFVFQFHHLLPEFSALENVMMPAMIQRMPQQQADGRARGILDIVGLSDRVDHRPGELSGGEQQRVAIARALVLNPKLLLADEPTGNLDEASAASIHDLLDDLNEKTGLTIVLVTHSSKLAERMPRRLVMTEGHLEAKAPGPQA